MKKKVIIVLVLLMLLIGCSSKENKEGVNSSKENVKIENSNEVYISAAASLKDVIGELSNEFNKENKDIKITPNFASSGALQTQIEEGAPCNIFISAADKQMDALEKKELIIKDTRVELLKNEVVLITPIDSKVDISKFDDVLKNKDFKIAIADPASVPVGQYSEEIFTKLGIWDKMKSNIVKSQDVRQTLDWVATKNVDLGTVYKTDAMIEKDKVKILATAPEGSHKDVNYPIGIIKDNDSTRKFYEFLKSDTAKTIFEKYGFVVNK